MTKAIASRGTRSRSGILIIAAGPITLGINPAMASHMCRSRSLHNDRPLTQWPAKTRAESRSKPGTALSRLTVPDCGSEPSNRSTDPSFRGPRRRDGSGAVAGMHETPMASSGRRSEAVVVTSVFISAHGGGDQLKFPLDTFRQRVRSTGFGLHVKADGLFRARDQSNSRPTSHS